MISEVAFGKPFGFVQTSSDVHTLIKSFHTGVQFLNTVGRWGNLKKAMRHPFVQRWLVPDLDKKIGIGRLYLVRFSPSTVVFSNGAEILMVRRSVTD